jgi:hypothetical protein
MRHAQAEVFRYATARRPFGFVGLNRRALLLNSLPGNRQLRNKQNMDSKQK